MIALALICTGYIARWFAYAGLARGFERQAITVYVMTRLPLGIVTIAMFFDVVILWGVVGWIL